jgi:hypothetical protein
MKMKNTITLIALILLSTVGFGQNGPKIEFRFKDNAIDYGTVSKKSDSGMRTIEFTNTGDAPLIISNVLSTPGFSILSKPNDAIATGKTGKINLKYSMISGPIRKTITVESNAVNYEGGIIALKIKGEVIE